MTTVSNKRLDFALSTTPEIVVQWGPSPHIQWSSKFSPSINVISNTTEAKLRAISNPVKTPNPRKTDSLTVVAIPKTHQDGHIAGWRLKSVILMQIRRTRKLSVATTWLEGLAEYGTGGSDSEAITDLIVSLGEYRESLEKREGKLGASAQRELNSLRNLIERAPVISQSGLPGTQ